MTIFGASLVQCRKNCHTLYGRRKGLKIPRSLAPCGFKSHLRHHLKPTTDRRFQRLGGLLATQGAPVQKRSNRGIFGARAGHTRAHCIARARVEYYIVQ